MELLSHCRHNGTRWHYGWSCDLLGNLEALGLKKLTLISGLLVSGHLYDISVQLLSNITWRRRLSFLCGGPKESSVSFLGGICGFCVA